MPHRLEQYQFHLPKERIALYPADRRDHSRLMLVDKETGATEQRVFADLPDILKPGDALVLNETRVTHARLYGQTANRTTIEILLTELLEGRMARGMVKGLKKLKTGQMVYFDEGLTAQFLRRENEFGLFLLNLEGKELEEWLNRFGRIPLPPYIDRDNEEMDKERYQTVYAGESGSCAAPTAGLHFTHELLEKLEAKGIKVFKILLHVGPGTFRPIQTDDIRKHSVDPEYVNVPAKLMDELAAVRKSGGRVVAVGTTTTRALETAAERGGSFTGKTNLFIYPGYAFKAIDGLITNFHLPGSSLLVLVAAFGGRENVLNAYEKAVEEEYRFYSYGDAMLILPPS